MSVLIKGLTIPTVGVRHCVIAFDNNRLLITDVCGNSIFDGNYVEIPTPHGRLIDADRLLAVLKSMASTNESVPTTAVLELIDHQPVVLKAEVSE